MPKLIPSHIAKALITAVQNKECLYDTNDPNYRNRNITEVAWKEVADELQQDVPACKSMWASLRCTFNRNLTNKRVAKEPKWRFFKQMLFLKEHVALGPVAIDMLDDDASICQDTNNEQMFLAFNYDSGQPDLKLDVEDIPAPVKSEPMPSTATSRTINDSGSAADTSGRSSATKGKKRKAAELEHSELNFTENKQRSQTEEKHLCFFRSLLPYFEMLTPVQQLRYMQQMTGILMDMVSENTPSSELK